MKSDTKLEDNANQHKKESLLQLIDSIEQDTELWKLINQHPHGTIRKLSFLKIAPKIVQLMTLMDEHLSTEECNRNELMNTVLTGQRDPLHQTVLDLILEYLIIIFDKSDDRTILYIKYPLQYSILPQLMDSLESELKTEQQCNWRRQQNMSVLIENVLRDHIDSSKQIANIWRIFEYLTVLIKACKNEELIPKLFNAFSAFPSHMLRTMLIFLIGSMESELKCESSFRKLFSSKMFVIKVENSIQWHSHNNMCAVIQQVLKANQNSLNHDLIDIMLGYLVKVILKCKNGDLILYSFSAFNHFPMDKLQNLLRKMIKSVKIETHQSKWYRNDNLSRVIAEVLKEHQNSLDQALIDQMFEYCTKLVKKRQAPSAIEALTIIKHK